tara:strand:- start:287 stop:889 length:603 start_codon:yes stop_codon:yes gene_type:complete
VSSDNNTADSSGESTYDRKQDTRTKEQKKKGTTYEAFKDGKSLGVDEGVKKSVEDYKQSKFNEGKDPNIKIYGFKIDPLNKMFKKGSEVTRNFYTDRVLKGKDLEKFRSLNMTQQEKQYKGYLDSRLSGETDAYGNVNPNYGKDNSSTVIKTEMQVDEESKAETEKPKTTEEEEAAYKKRKGLVGSRSLFSTGGQRGFFN